MGYISRVVASIKDIDEDAGVFIQNLFQGLKIDILEELIQNNNIRLYQSQENTESVLLIYKQEEGGALGRSFNMKTIPEHRSFFGAILNILISHDNEPEVDISRTGKKIYAKVITDRVFQEAFPEKEEQASSSPLPINGNITTDSCVLINTEPYILIKHSDEVIKLFLHSHNVISGTFNSKLGSTLQVNTN